MMTHVLTFFLSLFLVVSCSGFYLVDQDSDDLSIPSFLRDQKEFQNIHFQLENEKIVTFCQKIQERFIQYGWGRVDCSNQDWLQVGRSHLGDPLIWLVYGDELKHRETPLNSTLILCTVHGDEITPVKFCFDIINYLNELAENPEKTSFFDDRLVIVAPIVNPDSFFIPRPTRMNARGVDVNRNFPTRDWEDDALSAWKRRFRKDPRRYPGESALSEPETLFQVGLVRRYRPDKIISVHAPLTILDYDGPEIYGDDPAQELLNQMSRDADNYQVMNWPFFPGSLGNWAGNERKIPTYTLELPSSDNRKHREYWERFRPAIHSAIEFSMR